MDGWKTTRQICEKHFEASGDLDKRWLSSEAAAQLADEDKSMLQALDRYLELHKGRAGDSLLRAMRISIANQEVILRGGKP